MLLILVGMALAAEPCPLDGHPGATIGWTTEGKVTVTLDDEELTVQAAEWLYPAGFVECKGQNIEIITKKPYGSELAAVDLVMAGGALKVKSQVHANPGAAAVDDAVRAIEAGQFAEAVQGLDNVTYPGTLDWGRVDAALFEQGHKRSLQQFRSKDTAGAAATLSEVIELASTEPPVDVLNDYGFFLDELDRHAFAA